MERKTNKQKFQELTIRQKFEYIKDYYTWHILGSIVAIVAIIYTVQIMNRPEPPVYSTDLFITGIMGIDQATLDASTLEMQEQIDAGVSTIQTDWNMMDEMTYVNSQLMMIKMQSRETDVMVKSEVRYETYINAEDFEIYYPLETIPELEPILEKYKDQLIWDQVSSDTEEHVYGIRIDQIKNLEGIALAEEFVLCMMLEPKDLDAAVDLIYYILGEDN